jgi:hypothetical protein
LQKWQRASQMSVISLIGTIYLMVEETIGVTDVVVTLAGVAISKR